MPALPPVFTLWQIVDAVEVAQSHGDEICHVKLRRGRAPAQGIGANVPKLIRVRLIAYAAGVENDQKIRFIDFILSGFTFGVKERRKNAALFAYFSSFTAVLSASSIICVKPFCRSSAVVAS